MYARGMGANVIKLRIKSHRFVIPKNEESHY